MTPGHGKRKKGLKMAKTMFGGDKSNSKNKRSGGIGSLQTLVKKQSTVIDGKPITIQRADSKDSKNTIT